MKNLTKNLLKGDFKSLQQDLPESMFEQAVVGMAFVSSDGVLQLVNNTLVDMLGYSREELYAMNFTEFTHPEDVEKDFELFQQLVNEEIPSYRLEKRFIKKDGSILWADMSGTIIRDKQGTAKYFHAVAIDITAQKKIEEKLHEALKKAEKAGRAKSLFLANMSHEIRTPLNGVMGMIQLAGLKSKDPKIKEYLKYGIDSAKHLSNLINDILDLSKMDAGKFELDMQPFSVQEVLESSLHPYYTLAEEKDLELSCAIADDVPASVRGDSGRLRQILTNLIGNAVKFTEQGKITVNLKKAPTGPGQGKVKLLFNIQDTGIGIPRNKLKTIFNRFEQVRTSAHNKYGGIGLGLPIARELAKKMQGDIQVRSMPGDGSKFIFTAVFDLPEGMGRPQQDLGRHRLRILVAEDSSIDLRVAEEVLKDFGYDFLLVESGKQVLEKLSEEDFDIVLMDIQMPEMTGDQVVQLIRKGHNNIRRDLPVVALTSYGLEEDIKRFEKAGFDHYLTKPLDLDRLHEILEDVAKET